MGSRPSGTACPAEAATAPVELVPLRISWSPGDDGGRLLPPGRGEAVLWWPAGGVEALGAVLERLPGEFRASAAAGAEEAAPAAGDLLVRYLDPALAPYAAAYAASTGGMAVPLSAETELDALEQDRAAVVVGDLLAFPLRRLQALGCALPPGARRRHPVGFLHVDAGPTGLAHLVKNLLARLDLFPSHRGKLFLAPSSFGRAQAIRGPDGTYLLGDVEPEAFAEHLADPHGQLFALAHSEPFDVLFGQSVMCALADRVDARQPVPGPRDPDERAFPCFAGSGCVAAYNRPWIRQWLPASSFAATHATWLGCSVILHGDSPYRSRRALVFQLLAAPPTVSVLSSVQWTNDMPQELLHASFLLDGPLTLGEYHERLDAFTRSFRGSDPAGRMLLGDPLVVVPGDGAAGARPGAAVAWDGAGAAAVPVAGIRQRHRLEAPAPDPRGGRVYVSPVPGVSLLGSVVPADGGGHLELELLAAGVAGSPPGEVSLRAAPPLRSARRLLAQWHHRAAFWRTMVLTLRSSLRQAPDSFAPMLEQCEGCLDDLVGLEDVVDRAARLTAGNEPASLANWEGTVGFQLRFIGRAVAELQPRLMSLMSRYAGLVGPHLHGLWISSFVRGARRGAARCACGREAVLETWEAPFGGMGRVVLRCGRCDMVSDHEYGVRRPSFRLRSERVRVGEPIAGVLSGVRQHGGVPVVVGAALASEAGVDGLLALDSATVAGESGSLELSWSMSPARASAMQQVYVFVLNNLAWHGMRTWIQIERP